MTEKVGLGSLVQIRDDPKIERDPDERFGFVVARNRRSERLIVARLGLNPGGSPFEPTEFREDELITLAAAPAEMKAVAMWMRGEEGAGMEFYRIRREQVEGRGGRAS